MSIEELVNPKDFNIKDIVLKEPKKERPFDPRRDISEEEMGKLVEKLEVTRSKAEWYSFSFLASCLAVLGRPTEIAQTDWNGIDSILSRMVGESPSRSYINLCSYMAILGKTPRLSEKQIRVVERDMNRNRVADSYEFAKQAADMTLLRRPPNLIDVDWEGMEAAMEKFKKKSDWNSYSSIASRMVILGNAPNVTEVDWRGMNNVRNSKINKLIRSNDGIPYMLLTKSMAILAADKVIIPEGGGLKLVFDGKPDFYEPIPPMPTIRKF